MVSFVTLVMRLVCKYAPNGLVVRGGQSWFSSSFIKIMWSLQLGPEKYKTDEALKMLCRRSIYPSKGSRLRYNAYLVENSDDFAEQSESHPFGCSNKDCPVMEEFFSVATECKGRSERLSEEYKLRVFCWSISLKVCRGWVDFCSSDVPWRTDKSLTTNRCYRRAYCSRTCQKEDWNRGHKHRCQLRSKKLQDEDHKWSPSTELS